MKKKRPVVKEVARRRWNVRSNFIILDLEQCVVKLELLFSSKKSIATDC